MKWSGAPVLDIIETVQDYPTTHDPLLEFANNEKADNARPELATQIENPDSYNVIFLGYPNLKIINL